MTTWNQHVTGRPEFNFLFSGATIHEICNIEQAFLHCSLCQFSGALLLIFEGSFLHYGGEVARSPCVIFSLVTGPQSIEGHRPWPQMTLSPALHTFGAFLIRSSYLCCDRRICPRKKGHCPKTILNLGLMSCFYSKSSLASKVHSIIIQCKCICNK